MMYPGYSVLCHISSAYFIREHFLVHIIIRKEKEISIIVILICLLFTCLLFACPFLHVFFLIGMEWFITIMFSAKK